MDRLDFSSDRPVRATSLHTLKNGGSARPARLLLAASLAIVLAACASRGVPPGEESWQDGGSISDEATDAAGQYVVNRALLRQARDELAVMSQPATPEWLDGLAHNRPPRSVSETPAEPTRIGPADLIDAEAAAANQAATGRSSGGLAAALPAVDSAGAVEEATGAGDRGTVADATGQATEAARAEVARAEAASLAVTGSDAQPSVDAQAAAQTASQAESTAEEARPGLFNRMFGWARPASAATGAAAAGSVAADGTPLAAADASSAAGAGSLATAGSATVGTSAETAMAAASNTEAVASGAPLSSAIVTTAEAAPAPLAGSEAPVAARSNLPGPGEPGYIVSGHSFGGMQLALAQEPPAPQQAAAATMAADSDSAAAATAAGTAAGTVAGATVAGATVAAAAASERPVVTPVTTATTVVERPAPSLAAVTAAPPAQVATPAPVPVSPQPSSSRPEQTASLAPAPAGLPALAEVPVLDERALERGNFATLMGAMHGMVERCEPATQMRDAALKNYRATYSAVELDRNSRDDAAARISLDEEFVRSAAATLGSSRVNCDYVRSQSYGWNQLVGDLRHMSRDSARQYRPGLITEISRGAGIGRF